MTDMKFGYVLVAVGWILVGSVVLAISRPYLNYEYFSNGFADQVDHLKWNYLRQ